MKFLIIGAGAIGAYCGLRLTAAGHAVTYLVRPATAAQLRTTGLRLTDGAEVIAVAAPTLAESPAQALADGPEVAVLALKAYDTARAIADLRAVTTTPPPILCLQNGLGNEAALAAAFGPERVIAGTVTTAVGRRGPGEVAVERRRGLGVATGHPLSAAVLAALNAAGLNARGYASAEALKWSKLLTNLTGNATAAILDLTVAEVFAHPGLFALEMRMLRECLAVMAARRIPVVDLPRTPVRALAWATRLPAGLARPVLGRAVAGGRGGKRPSFHIDLHSGRPTEVRWLNGAVAEAAAALGLAAPVNRVLTETLEALSADPAARERFRGQPAQLLNLISA